MITKETEQDLRLPNEPFEIFGQLMVSRSNNQWTHEEMYFAETESMTFPDENYQYEDIQPKGFAIGAYDNDQCVGLAIFDDNWNKYIYLNDLKVNSSFRKMGVASGLLAAGRQIAEKKGYKGMYTVAQDNNLAACKFYLKQGFEIGGLNTKIYHFTKQTGKADIYFYHDW